MTVQQCVKYSSKLKEIHHFWEVRKPFTWRYNINSHPGGFYDKNQKNPQVPLSTKNGTKKKINTEKGPNEISTVQYKHP